MSTAAPSSETSNGFLSKGRLAWAGVAAVGGCAALCSLPVLAAGVVGTGAVAAAVSRFVTPGAELAVGGIAFVLVLGVMGLRAVSKIVARRVRAEPA